MPKEQNLNALVWFTTNLRTRDNRALTKALQSSENVQGVFCIDPEWFVPNSLGFPKMHAFRTQLLLESLNDLAQQLFELKIPFEILVGNPKRLLPEFLNEHNISKVFRQKEWTSEEQDVFHAVQSSSPEFVEWNEYYDQFLIPPNDLPLTIEKLPFQFTSFRKQVEKSLKIQPEVKLPSFTKASTIKKAKVPNLESLGYDSVSSDDRSAFPFKGGEQAALDRLKHYFWETDAIQVYKETRNGLVGTDYSSKFSPWLALGCISPRIIYHELIRYEKERGANQSTYWLLFELLWRDFFKYVSMKHGNTLFHLNGLNKSDKYWSQNQSVFQKWMDGTTDSPFVNANMLELKHTGWMSNRGRQNVASYLTKTLNIDWRWGAAYFESFLIDYDVHSNYGNWAYLAGVGNDPRDRVFNVERQAELYDPDKAFQKLWLSKVESP